MSNHQHNIESKTGDCDGIDLQEALQILADRQLGEHHHNNHCDHAPTTNAVHWGQSINLGAFDTGDGEICDTSSHASLMDQKERLDLERSQRREILQQRLASLSATQLLRCVLDAQEKRVVTYRDFDVGLEDLLRSGNMSLYPNVCAEATASFSVLSDTINAVRCTLEQQDRHEWTLLIVRLQKAEQQKLNLSAALHLERIRAQSQQQEVENDAESYEGRKDTLTSTLLNESVKSLQRSIATIVEEINEVLVDIQCALSEEFD